MADTARLYGSIAESLSRSALNSNGSPPPSHEKEAPKGAAAALEDALRAAGIRGSIRDQAKAVSRRPSARGLHHHRDGAAEKHHGRHHHHHDTGTMRVAPVGGVSRKERESRALPPTPPSPRPLFLQLQCQSSLPPLEHAFPCTKPRLSTSSRSVCTSTFQATPTPNVG